MSVFIAGVMRQLLGYIGSAWFVSQLHPHDGRRRKKVTVQDPDWLAERFEENRTQLRAVAYRMVGLVSEADGAVQDGWLRLSRADTREVQNLGGWLTTVVGRVCLASSSS
jgi:hypothetical protein